MCINMRHTRSKVQITLHARHRNSASNTSSKTPNIPYSPAMGNQGPGFEKHQLFSLVEPFVDYFSHGCVGVYILRGYIFPLSHHDGCVCVCLSVYKKKIYF